MIDDGKNRSDTAMESICVPIIHDADEYMEKHVNGEMFTIIAPPGAFGSEDGCIIAFLPEHGREIEAWMDKYVQKGRGDQLVFQLEDTGHIRIGVCRGGH